MLAINESGELYIATVERNIVRTFMLKSISLSGKSCLYDRLYNQGM